MTPPDEKLSNNTSTTEEVSKGTLALEGEAPSKEISSEKVIITLENTPTQQKSSQGPNYEEIWKNAAYSGEDIGNSDNEKKKNA